MATVLLVLKWVAAPLISICITLLLSEPLRERLAPIVARFGTKTEDGITGQWLTTFHYSAEPNPFTEVVEISLLLGGLVGGIVPNSANFCLLIFPRDLETGAQPQ
jgi:hypothetical protein